MIEHYAQPSLLAGAKAPEKLRIVILPGSLGIDLRTVNLVTLRVEVYSGNQSWAAQIVEQLQDRLVVEHVFDVDGFETRSPGRYRIIPVLTLTNGSGVRRATSFFLAVT